MSIWGMEANSFMGARAQTQPAFAAAGAGTVSTGAGVNVAYPTGIIAGSILVLHMHGIDAAAVNTVTPSGWTQVTTGTTGAGPQTTEAIYLKIADGTESGTLAPGWTSGTQIAGRMYRFTGTYSGTESPNTSVVTASSTTLPCGAVTTMGVAELGVACLSAAVSTTVGDAGSGWTEAVAEYNTTTGGNLTMQLQTVSAAAAGTYSSSGATLGSAGTNRFNGRFALQS